MLMIKGYDRRQFDQLLNTRMICYITYCANTKDPKSIDSFMPLDSGYEEITDEEDELSPLQIQFLIEQMKQKFNKVPEA